MGRSRSLGTWAVVACLLYMVIAVPNRRHENFPVFAWDLFVTVPSPHQSNYGIRLVEVRGRPLDPPRYFEDADGVVANPTSIDAYTLTQRIGSTLHKEPGSDPKAMIALFDDRFLGGLGPVRYEVVERTFDIKKRAECHCFRSEKVLATYEAG